MKPVFGKWVWCADSLITNGYIEWMSVVPDIKGMRLKDQRRVSTHLL